MRCQRTMMSICVWLSMWPMCRRPVTLGGGSSRVNTGRDSSAAGVRRRKEFFFCPVLGPAGFNRARLVRFGEIVGHLVRASQSPNRNVLDSQFRKLEGKP